MLALHVALVMLTRVTPSAGGLGSGILEAVTVKPIKTYVQEKGYPIEEHQIETEDGYKLTYHRVPHGRPGQGRGHGHPVLLAHGILQSSALFLAMDDGIGFDVWLMNARGNTYSRTRTPTWQYGNTSRNKEFWDFSFHEMGRHDLPAAIEHILAVTSRPSLSYVGFSMGTAMFWVLADSWGPRYMDRVDTMVAIAPIARPSGMGILHKPKLYKTLKAVISMYILFHSYEVRPFNPAVALLLRAMCSKGHASRFCTNMLSGLMGLFPDSIHYEDTYVSTQYMPAGTSIKNVQHFMQIGEKASFQQFDYGESGNRKHYESSPGSSPPGYDLQKVTCPVFFITSDKDVFSVKEDVDWLSEQLPAKPQILFYDAVKDFHHLDYFYSKNVKNTFFAPLVDFIKERTKQLQN